LRKRYGADYRISIHDDRGDALGALESLREQHFPVALVLSALGDNDAGGIEFFESVRPLHPEAKRVAVVRWGDFPTVRPIFNAITLGQLDHWVMAPEYSPDEEFHRSITEFLEDWAATSQGRGFEAVRIIDKHSSPRAHELRDTAVTTSHMGSTMRTPKPAEGGSPIWAWILPSCRWWLCCSRLS